MFEVIGTWPALVASLVLLVLTEIYQRWRDRQEYRVRNEKSRAPQESEIKRLRNTIRELKARNYEQTAYFVSFSESVKALVGAVSVRAAARGCEVAIGSLLQTPHVAVMLMDEKSELRLVQGTGFPTNLLGRYVFPTGDGERALAEILDGGVVTTIADFPRVQKALRPIGEQWTHAVPITSEEKFLGLVVLSKPIGDLALVERVLAMLTDLTSVALVSAAEADYIRREAQRRGLSRQASRPRPGGTAVRSRRPITRVPVVESNNYAVGCPSMPSKF